MIVRVASDEDLPEMFALRHEVFVVGQDVPEELERDELDARCTHAVAVVEERIVGTGRLLPGGTIGRMAVAAEARRQGVGAAVLAFLEAQARAQRLPLVELHAQVHAAGFYERAGYIPFGEVYLEAGIEHQSMRKPLS